MMIAFARQGKRVTITIHDDGKGLNLKAIEKRARQSGLIQDKESLTQDKILDCIFASGFSSADRVSKVAGRGVGMDTIRQFVLEAGGAVGLNIDEPRQGFAAFSIVIDLPIKLFPDAADDSRDAA